MKPTLDKISEIFIENLKIDKPLFKMTPQEARTFLKDLQKEYYSNVEGEVESLKIFNDSAGEIDIKLVYPKSEEPLPLIIYCHGGGWVMGDFEDFEITIKTIANISKSAIAFINYSRSPEFQFPTAIKQIYAALEFFSKNADNPRINTEKISLMGDSAGANMAFVTAMNAKYSEIKIQKIVLVYPVCDASMKTNSYNEYKNGPWLSKKAMEWFWNSYNKDKEAQNSHFMSILNTLTEDMQGLPPTLVITAENDVLRDEGEEFARKLIKANVETISVRINNVFHDFTLLNVLKESPAVKFTYKIIGSFLNS